MAQVLPGGRWHRRLPRSEALRAVRRRRHGVVLMSAAPLQQGVVGASLIPKPFDLDALLEQVHHLLASTRR